MTTPIPAPPPGGWIALAETIGHHICREAAWSADRCTWTVHVHHPSGTLPEPALGFIYDGTAGMALFLTRLHQQSPSPGFLRAAQGALRQAVALEAESGKARAGYYSGTGGVASACVTMHDVDPEGPWLEHARALCRTMASGFVRDGVYDVVSGEAGSILGLLHVYQATRDRVILEDATRLGWFLVQNARLEPHGVSWDTLHPAVFRNPVGMSHGTGGIALALLELHRWSGLVEFLHAAHQALAYEDTFYDPGARNWMDLRDMALTLELEKDGAAGLQRTLAKGPRPPSSPGMMTAWCHGAPGAALVRAHFFALTGSHRWRGALQESAACTLASLQGRKGVNHSLCHGLFGNCDSLLVAGRTLRDASLVERVAERVAQEVEEQHHSGAGWRSGGREGAPTPGLLLGESGVGLFFLRLASPEIPSPLLPVCAPPSPIIDGDGMYGDSLRRGMLQHFPRTRNAMLAAGANLSTLEPTGEDPTGGIRSLLATLEPGAAATVEEALSLEDQAFTLLRGQRNFAEAYCRSLMRRPPGILEDPETRIHMAPTARLVHTRHDWEVMLTPGTTLDDLPANPTGYVIFEAAFAYRIRRLPPAAAAVCALVQEPKRVSEAIEEALDRMVVEGLLSAKDGQDAAHARATVREAIRKAYLAEIVDVVEPEMTPADVVGDLCTRCGECCRVKIYIAGDEAYAQFLKEVLEAPLRSTYPEAIVRFDSQDGGGQVLLDLGYCRHLQHQTGPEGDRFLCGVYAERPEVCRSFNCVAWWQLQRVRADGLTASDRLIRHVATLKSRIGKPSSTGTT